MPGSTSSKSLAWISNDGLWRSRPPNIEARASRRGRRAVPAAGRSRRGLRELPAHPGRARRELEQRRRAPQGLPRGRDHRPQLRALPSARGPRGGAAAAAAGHARAEGRVEHEGWRVRKDGSRFWADVVITALRDNSGQPIGFAKVTRDLTA